MIGSPLKPLILLIFLSTIAAAQKSEFETYKGVLRVGKYESTINYFGEETGDLAVFCFKNKSAVGRAIFSKCKDGKMCKFTAKLKWEDCRVSGDASATGRIVSIKSVRRV